MGTSTSKADGSVASPGSGHRAFLLRKLHSLCGVVPLGVFLILHLWTYASALAGRRALDDAIATSLADPFTWVLELILVFVPLSFHALYGLTLTGRGHPNLTGYPKDKHWGYVMQRLTGVVTFVFVVAHLYQFRFQRFHGRLEAVDFYGELCASLSSTHWGVPWIALGYLLGLGASVFHFSNGLYGFCFSWGITRSLRATRISSVVFGCLGIALFVLGATIIIYFATGSRLMFTERARSDEQVAHFVKPSFAGFRQGSVSPAC